MPAAELLTVFSLITAYLPARMRTELLENTAWFVIDEYLLPGLHQPKASRIVPILFPAPLPEGQTLQSAVLPRN